MTLQNLSKRLFPHNLRFLDSAHTRQHRASHARTRRIRVEALERRELMAADLRGFQHNRFDPEDVNDDGAVSAADVLIVINSMNRNAEPESTNFIDVNEDGQRSPLDALLVINRLNRANQSQNRGTAENTPMIPRPPREVRSLDGTGNNRQNSELGSTGEALLRIGPAEYGDGVSTPAGTTRPSARQISNVVATDLDESPNDRSMSAFIYVWGQFIDHDIDLTMPAENGESFAIQVPNGDKFFDPASRGNVTIPLTRSTFDSTTGTSVVNPRQQINSVTAYIDGSMVYGSNQATADALRSFTGGRLKVSELGLLPTDAAGKVMAGDIRAGENISLTAIHALFVREHNRLADQIAKANPGLNDESVYQQVRAIVIAEIQAISYNEFLPALLGRHALSRYRGYDATVDPSVANEFSTAAFRFGHSTLNDDVEFFDNNGRPVREGISLAEAFNKAELLKETGIDSILKYDASTVAQEVDLEVIDSLRNFLFGPPGAGGFDLVSLNIQRGRDHGLADYNATRMAYGLSAVDSFDDITSNVVLQDQLEDLYVDIDDIDLWVGLLAEDHVRGASVGELAQTIIADQFERLRDGDRFWYENVYAGRDLSQLRNTSLASLIERNTSVSGLQENVFFMRAEASGRVTWATPVNTVVDNVVAGDRRDNLRPHVGVAGVSIELLNDTGEVIEVAVTDRQGNYRFRSFVETGDYQVRLADSNSVQSASTDVLSVLIPSGDTRVKGLNFSVNRGRRS